MTYYLKNILDIHYSTFTTTSGELIVTLFMGITRAEYKASINPLHHHQDLFMYLIVGSYYSNISCQHRNISIVKYLYVIFFGPYIMLYGVLIEWYGIMLGFLLYLTVIFL